jgi:hypothetical protein
MVNFRRYILLVVLLVASATNAAPSASPQSFKLPGHGELQLRVPASWAATVSQPSENLPPTIEGTLPPQELSGAANHGYYFKATDRAPKVGEFKYLTQGIVCLGEINLAFTVLTNDGQDSVIKAALDAMREALQVTTTA